MASSHQGSHSIWDIPIPEQTGPRGQATVPSTPRFNGQSQAPAPMSNFHHHGQQSLDYGQRWNNYVTDHGRQVVPFRGLASSSWASAPPPPYASPAPSKAVPRGNIGESQLVPWIPSGVTTPRPAMRATRLGNFTSEMPTPAEIEWMNAWSDGSANNYAYFMDRGEGRVTRMIPADMLPPLVGVPPQELRGHGMETLQPLRGSPPYGVPPTDQLVIVRDMPRVPKRDKDFCDKWIHEGVCAFVQQGCRYKHEMPMDRAGQIKMGLFQGLPRWYKEQKALEKTRADDAQARRSRRQSEPPARPLLDEPNSVDTASRATQGGSWPDAHGHQARRNEGSQAAWRLGNPPSSADLAPPCDFGAIGQPRQRNH